MNDLDHECLIRTFLNADLNRVYFASDYLRELIAQNHFVYVSSDLISKVQKELKLEHRF